MSQRVRSALRFLVVIVPALLIASLITLVVPNGWDIVHYGQCLLWLLVAVCSILFFRRTGGWPGLLIAIGSTAYFVTHTESLVAAYVMKRGLIPPDDPLWQLWGFFLWDNTFGIAMLCFPTGFLWYMLRVIRGA
jgi:hypothetical protein